MSALLGCTSVVYTDTLISTIVDTNENTEK